MSIFEGTGHEIPIDQHGHTPVSAPPEIPKLAPREWVKENLFSSPFNSVLTVVTTIILLAVFRGFLSFIFNPVRQWDSTATNMQLFMTRAYPDEQYIRVWFCVAVLLILTGLSLAVWQAGSTRSEERRVGKECRSRWSPYH